jgi:murein DD-endopeptidase MepM/ murein hydrolase activator NlpD
MKDVYHLKVGEKVKFGQRIGNIGNTGKCNGNNTGPHLHFEVRKNTEYQNNKMEN